MVNDISTPMLNAANPYTSIRECVYTYMPCKMPVVHIAQLAIPTFSNVFSDPVTPEPDLTGQDASTIPTISKNSNITGTFPYMTSAPNTNVR